jgi:AcrR family transcriptional regulator
MASTSSSPEKAIGPRERIIAAATELFYESGLHAVSADRIIAAAGISKVTFYRYFPTKEDLIVAYLETRAAGERAGIAPMFEGRDWRDGIRSLANGIGAESCSEGFRGCPFINAAAEYPDPQHPIRKVVDEHRAWYTGTIAAALREGGSADADQIAREMLMIRDGAMMMGYLDDPKAVSDSLYWGMSAVAEFAHRR